MGKHSFQIPTAIKPFVKKTVACRNSLPTEFDADQPQICCTRADGSKRESGFDCVCRRKFYDLQWEGEDRRIPYFMEEIQTLLVTFHSVSGVQSRHIGPAKGGLTSNLHAVCDG
jgi:hypothetical protein